MRDMLNTALLCMIVFSLPTWAEDRLGNGVTAQSGLHVRFDGDDGLGSGNDTLLYTATGLLGFTTFEIQVISGTVDVEVSLDGETWSSAHALYDLNSEDTSTAVLSATTGSTYGFRGQFEAIRVRQVGSTNAESVLLCTRF